MNTASPYTTRPPVSPAEADESLQAQIPLFGSSLEAAFWKFHAENPHVYRLLLHFTRQARYSHDHYSIDAIFQRARWHADIETRDPDGFKLNDHHRAYYARLLNLEPGLEGFFRTRELRGEPCAHSN